MVITVKDADFSANNIGTIVIPRNYNAFTLQAIVLSGNEDMTTAQKNALDIFFESVGAFGNESQIWAKLDKVYLPMICSALNKSFVNYISGNTDAEPDSSWLELRNKGVGRIENATKGDTCILDTNYVWNWGNKSAFVFNNEELNSLGSCGVVNYSGYYGLQYESLQLIKNNTYSEIRNFAYANVNVCPQQAGDTGILPGLKGISSNGENCVWYGSPALETMPSSRVAIVNSDAVQYFNSNPKNLYFASSTNGGITVGTSSIGAVVLGTYLTQAECERLGAAFNDLWEAFGV